MTKNQRITIMADWWPKACETQGWNAADRELRLKVFSQAVGRSLSSASELDQKDDVDAVKRHLGFLADNVAATIETDHASMGLARRLRWKLENVQMKQLAVYVEEPAAYVRQILRERFKIFRGISTVEDLDAKPRYREVNGERKKLPSPLLMLVMTLDRCIDDLRGQAGDTIHKMNMLAGVACRCKECSMGKRLTAEEVAALGESDLAGETEAVVQEVKEGEPF